MTEKNWSLDLPQIGFLGHDLTRPECVLCSTQGDVFVSHFGGGVTRIQPDGTQQNILGNGDVEVATNGFAITREGDFLCANLLPPGGVWRITQEGEQTPFLTAIDGYELTSVNFVHVDSLDRVWITISTRREPRSLGYRPDVDDGFIILVDVQGPRIVAEGLGYTNEAKVDPTGKWLYVNETFGRRTSRFAIRADNKLGSRETVAEYGPGTYPDGLDFDELGGVWLTSVISNRVIRIDPDGKQQVVLEDNDPATLAEVETIFQAGELGRPQMDNIAAEVLQSVSSIAFGGADRKTIFLGNLLDNRIYTFPSPIAGAEPPHWRFAV